ncbi:MAG TPA: hypothetical protein VHB21_24240 [Minicystis sp.]|nr:hypothetical protein [Minicystis sp.]
MDRPAWPAAQSSPGAGPAASDVSCPEVFSTVFQPSGALGSRSTTSVDGPLVTIASMRPSGIPSSATMLCGPSATSRSPCVHCAPSQCR